jgi:hypothetical protein
LNNPVEHTRNKEVHFQNYLFTFSKYVV